MNSIHATTMSVLVLFSCRHLSVHHVLTMRHQRLALSVQLKNHWGHNLFLLFWCLNWCCLFMGPIMSIFRSACEACWLTRCRTTSVVRGTRNFDGMCTLHMARRQSLRPFHVLECTETIQNIHGKVIKISPPPTTIIFCHDSLPVYELRWRASSWIWICIQLFIHYNPPLLRWCKMQIINLLAIIHGP